jgi:hypothetical protein
MPAPPHPVTPLAPAGCEAPDTLLELPLRLVAEDAEEGPCIVELLHRRDFDPGG